MKDSYRVVRIIDDTSLIVNAGIENNVEIGDAMVIYGESENIFDPETNEDLGRIEIIKVRLNVTKVYQKMCICETSYVSQNMSSLLSASLFSSNQRKLDVDPTEISGSGDKVIRLGDNARLIKNENKAIKNLSAIEEEKKAICEAF